jgi:hypothetical protein
MHPIRVIIPLVFIVLFSLYIAYLLIKKKDKSTVKKVLYPGLFFIGVWAAIYFLIFR